MSRPVVPVALRAPVVLFVTALVVYGGFLGGSDDHVRAHLTLTRALAERGTVVVDELASQTHDLAFRNGHYYVAKPPGFAFTVAPAWWLLGAFGAGLETKWKVATFLFSSLPGAAAAALATILLRRLGAGATRAVTGGIAVSFGTGLFGYSTLFLETPLVILALLGAFALLAEPDAEGAREIAAGLLLGYATLLQYLVAFCVVPAGILLLVRHRRALPVARFALGAAIPVSGILLYNWLCFRNPFLFGHFTSAVPQFQRFVEGMASRPFVPRWEAVVGLLVSARKGAFAWSPFLLFGVVGLVGLIRRPATRGAAALAAGSVVVTFVFISSLPNWDGGALSGPRYILPVLPFLAVGLAGLDGVVPPGVGRWVGLALGAAVLLSVAIWFVVTAVAPFSNEWLPNPLLTQHLPDFLAGRIRPLRGQAWLPAGGFARLFPVVVLGLGGTALAFVFARQEERGGE